MIPVTVIRRGEGPTVLFTGGNHGDEYEGPIALSKLAATLKAGDMNGRVIIVPFMNFPRSRRARALRRSMRAISTAVFRASPTAQ